MPVLIKHIDPELYAKFKAKAIEQGLKIDEAFAEAVKLWINTKKPLSHREELQEKNELIFRLMKDKLEKQHLNKWVSIVDGKILAVADTIELLFVELGKTKKNENPGLIFQVGMEPRKVRLGFKRIERR